MSTLKIIIVKVGASAICSLVLLSAAFARAEDRTPREFDIRPQSLAAALSEFARQADQEILFAPQLVAEKKFEGIRGKYPPLSALHEMLEGTGLKFMTTPSGAILIQGAGSSTVETQSSADSAGADEPNNKKESKNPTEGSSVDGAKSSAEIPRDVETKGIPEILVKGSRVMNLDVTRTEDDVQSYYILDSQAIEQSGATSVEEFLKLRLTMNTTARVNSQGYVSQLGTTSTINLRGLGADKTLILINGRRSAGVNYFGNANQPDINGIPLSAIERIEVLPTSASAIYGGAAVGGVVNIILKRQFAGGDFRYSYSDPSRGDAPVQSVGGSYGFAMGEGRTQVMLAGHYADGDLLLMKDRVDLTQRGFANILRNSPSLIFDAFNPFPGATPNVASADYSTYPVPVNLVLRDGTPLNSPITYVPTGTEQGSELSADLLSNAGVYNLNLATGTGLYGLQNAIGTVPREKAIAATIRHEFTSAFEAFAEYSTKSNASRTLYNPFYTSFIVPSTAPTNPFQQNVAVVFPSNLSTPYTSDSVTQSVTVGFLADLPGNWKSEVDYTWSRNSFEFANDAYDSSALSSALATGAVNPFVDTLAYPLDLSSYLAPVNFDGSSTLNDLNLRFAGVIGSFPWGNPTLTIGLEHRKEGNEDANYYQVRPLNPASNAHQVYFGQSQSTDSVYLEALVPLVTPKNARAWLRSLELQLAGRSERYSVNAGTTVAYLAPDGSVLGHSPPQGIHQTIEYTSTNPTIGLKYKPVDDLTFRASYAQGFLPPTVSQFLPDSRSYCCQSIVDPEDGQRYSVNFIQGGNPNLHPQTSKSWNLGVIWEPRQDLLAGLRMNLEYYEIVQPDYITPPAPQQVVSDPAYASRVTRDPMSGRITTVNISYLNALEYKTKGWDVNLDYSKSTRYGTFDVHALGTAIQDDRRQYTIDGPSLDYVGYPGEGGAGKTKANLTFSWEYRNWTLGANTTYYGSYSQVYGSPGSPYALQYGPNTTYTDAQGGDKIPSQMYHGIFGGFAFDKAQGSRAFQQVLSGLAVQFAINNVSNKTPPFDAFYAPYFYSPYGDVRMRDYRISLRKSF